VRNHRRSTPLPGGATPFDRHCAPCHEPQEFEGKRLDRKGWEEVVRRMHERDPKVVPLEKTGEIVDYFLNLPKGEAPGGGTR
jgi:hypothetical protein